MVERESIKTDVGVAASAPRVERESPAAPSIGNAALVRNLDELGIHRRARVGTIDDPAEEHADAMADQAMAALGIDARPPTGSTASPGPDELGGAEVGADVQHALAGATGGRPLDSGTRATFEATYGMDLGHVRLHTDDRAATLSDAVQAEAFTHGANVYFAAGRFQPSTASGQHLLAHELAHVVQDSPAGIRRKPSTEVVRRFPWGKKRRKRKQLREVERGGRAAIAEKVAGGSDKNDATDFLSLQQRFQEQLEFEKGKVAEYLKAGDDQEEAEQKAYADAWEDDSVDPDLKKLAPMRKTRSEKHGRKVDALFGQMAARSLYDDQQSETAQSGTIVHKPIAKLIDKIEEMAAPLAESAIARKTSYENDKAGTTDYAISPADKERHYETARRVAARHVLVKDDDKWVKKYKELPKAIKDEAHKRSRARIAARKLIDGGKSKEARSREGVEAAHEDHEERIGYVQIGNQVQSGGATAATKALGLNNKQEGRTTLSQAIKGKATVTESTKFTPQEQAHGMISGISDGLKSVVDLVGGVQGFIKKVQIASADGSAERDPGAVIALIKDGMALLQAPFKAAKSGMEAARSFSGAEFLKVAGIIPVMDIVTSALGMVADIVDLVGAAMQWASNRAGILRAKMASRTELIDSIKRLKMRSATFIGKAIKHLIDNAVKLGSTIASIASGGLAAPAKAAIAAVGFISTGGEILFDHVQSEMIARKTKSARGHYTEKLTGSAEERFRNDAKVSIAGLIVAATGDDAAAKKVARKVLGQYGSYDFDADGFDPRAVLAQVLKRMGDDADPLTHKEQLEEKFAEVKHMRRGMLDKIEDAKNLKTARNATAVGGKTDRGPFYVLREVLRNAGDRRRMDRKMEQMRLTGMHIEGTRQRRVRAREDADREDMAKHSFTRPSMASIAGKLYDLNDPTAESAILDAVEKANPIDLKREVARLRALNARNPPMQELLDKILAASVSKVAAGV